MTLIIGCRCQNGIVIGTDTLELRGGEPGFGNKIFEMSGVQLAAAGLTGVRDDFLLLLSYEMKRSKGFETLYEFKVAVEDIISELSKRYGERTQEGDPVAVLVGGLVDRTSGEAQLYLIHSEGYGEAVKFICVGHGAPYATTIAKFLYDSKCSIQDMAYRIAFIISWVSEDVDVTVGGVPQVAMIEDNKPQIGYLEKGLVQQTMALAKERKNNLAKFLQIEKVHFI